MKLISGLMLVLFVALASPLPRVHAQDTAAACEGDITKDGQVDAADITQYLVKFRQFAQSPELDVNGDSRVSLLDFLKLVWNAIQHCTYTIETPAESPFEIPE